MSKGFNSSGFEDFVFHDSFYVLIEIIKGSFSRMFEAALDTFGVVGDAWSDNESFLSLGTLLCLIKTAFFGSIGVSYFVVTSLTMVSLSTTVFFAFLLLTVFFALYQVIIGIMFGIVNAVTAYTSSLIENTFKA